MTNSLTCKPATRVVLWPSDVSWNHGNHLRELTTKRYHEKLKTWGLNALLEYRLKQSEALKWIYENCRRNYRITYIFRGETYNSPAIFVCDFTRETDAVAFKLMFGEVLEPEA